MRAGVVYSASAWATSSGSRRACSAAPLRSARDSARGSALQWARPSAISGFRLSAVQAARAAPAWPSNTRSSARAARSRMRSPMATPGRNASWLPRRRNTAYGRFCTGKPVPSSLALATQLVRLASWVSFRVVMGCRSVGLGGVEVLLQPLPAFVIVALQLRACQRLRGGADDAARLEHERHRIADIVRLPGVGGRGFLEGAGVGAVPAHAIVQAGAARREAVGLGVVDAVDQAHELAGDV